MKYRRSSELSPELKVAGPSMLGTGCPDRHAPPHVTSPKTHRPRRAPLPRERVRSSGHEDPFTRPRLNARCRLGEPTFAGMGGKEEGAPIPDTGRGGVPVSGLTNSGP